MVCAELYANKKSCVNLFFYGVKKKRSVDVEKFKYFLFLIPSIRHKLLQSYLVVAQFFLVQDIHFGCNYFLYIILNYTFCLFLNIQF